MNIIGIHRSLVAAASVLLVLTACGSTVTSAPTVVALAPTIDLATVVPTMTVAENVTATADSDADMTATDTGNETAVASRTITKTLDTGMVLYQQPSEGFAIALPATWQQFDPTDKQFQASLNGVIEKNPSFNALLTSQAKTMIAGNIKFMGVDLTSDALTTGYLTNVNIIKQDLPVAAPADMVLDATVQQFDGMSNIVKPVTHQIVKLPAGEAGQLQYHLKLATATSAKTEAAIVQYLFVKDKTLYIVSMGTPAADQATYQPIFEQLAQTFQFLP